LHCGFIAHSNIKGFYGEYFETAAHYHFNVNGYSNPMSEYSGNLNVKSTLSHEEQFYAIYEELNGSRNGLGEFYDTLISNYYDEYKDLNDAIKDAFNEYLSIWRDEIKKALNAYEKFLKNDEVKKLKAEKENKAEKAKQLLNEANFIEEQMFEIKTVQDKLVLRDHFKSGQTTLFDFLGESA
jgi:hypothetical protein